MTDFSSLLQPDKGQAAHDIHLVTADGFEDWLKGRPERERETVKAQNFDAAADAMAILPGEKADDWSVLACVADPDNLVSWSLSKTATALPSGEYRLVDHEPGRAALGWLLAHYAFDRYKESDKPAKDRILLTGKPHQIDEIVALAEATCLVRDLVNTPAEDMGPADLQKVAEEIAAESVAALTVTQGKDLEKGYPMIHAVGRAATEDRAPRLIELEWGNPKHPRIAIVGKGVVFDSGGLDIKSSAGMLIMKKDMGGAAHALALANLVIGAQLPVRLHLLIPAVENSISANAFRPGDIIASRKGLSVEIGNTDAEGRLILGDALTRACESGPELVIDFATLTGAARVALGPDLPALFTDDEDLAAELAQVGTAVDDPVWRLPLWDGYEELLRSDIADIGNAATNGMAGASTAALFLRKFVESGTVWAHFDTYAWRGSAKPARPKGGEALGLRASWAVLKQRYATG
ncbi:MAG: leucyl aminopeptidase family protein [Sphingomonadaceae bacterium]|nr:leucyl aminopeptidase family protein [Sphingomonadaceae bacterium]